MNKTIKDFWEEKHTLNDVLALSGCRYKETIDFLQISDYINLETKVLEVGTGLGYVTKGLFDAGTKVSALDISTVSLNRVKSYCESTYNIENISELPSNYFDIIICNNVVQHIPTMLLIEEFKELIRSLTLYGILAVEFVSTDYEEDTGVNPTLVNIQNGGLCRTPTFLAKLLTSVGGKSKLVFDKEVDINIVKGHHVFHVMREEL